MEENKKDPRSQETRTYTKRFTRNYCTKVAMNPNMKQKIAIVLDVSKTIFHWGFIPLIYFIGFRKGADPGMPQLSVVNLLWK
ncbi:PREDICTED: mitochondrial import receptor subunit TOM7 homolog [Eufriesea mexicana]|uniref:mitochondrial import receptor subunit TOM7 homolog n=1 Tax=Eufriesea mexicana TaxID=516756 RepID=UPI00083C027E|nr:PREDICTED: mitochondrial import receptor subunit TOM7 homolog [Eufriesea mexicana]